MGERYLDSIYNDDWVMDKFGPAVLDISRRSAVYTMKTNREDAEC